MIANKSQFMGCSRWLLATSHSLQSILIRSRLFKRMNRHRCLRRHCHCHCRLFPFFVQFFDSHSMQLLLIIAAFTPLGNSYGGLFSTGICYIQIAPLFPTHKRIWQIYGLCIRHNAWNTRFTYAHTQSHNNFDGIRFIMRQELWSLHTVDIHIYNIN